MMDSVFYLGLIVTFVLIILLAYHFKQRVSILEEKNHTMFEILNNVVKELNVIRMNQMQYINIGRVANNETTDNVLNVDNAFYETREVADSDDYNSEEGSESEPDSESESESESDDESSNVKLIKVNEEMSVADIPEVDTFDLLDENNTQETEEDHVQELNDEITLKVEKVDNYVDESNTQDDYDDDDDDRTGGDKNYASYTLAQLKTMVISQGLSTNPSKLKKSEVIALLEENDKQ